MLRTFAILLLIAVAVNARAAPQRTTIAPDYEATEEVPEQSTYMSVEEGTITVDVDSDVILTTSPEGESFTEASPMVQTEEPLPDSVVQQLEMERAQEERLKNPQEPETELESETEEESTTTTEQPKPNSTTSTTKRSFRFGETTLPSFITTTGSPGIMTTFMPKEEATTRPPETEETTEYQEVKTMRNYFERKPAPMGEVDLDMAENRMEATTNMPAEEPMELSMMVTTDAALVEETSKLRIEAEQAEPVETTTVLPLYQLFNKAARIVTEPQPETTTAVPKIKEEVSTTESVIVGSTELPLASSTAAPETTTESEETTTPASSTTTTTTEAVLLTTKEEPLLNVQPESSTGAPETTTTSAPESSTSAPETTTTSTPETTTTSAPETTTTSAPSTTTTTSTTDAPTTTSTTSSTTTPTTTTTERLMQTRAPRVERIFNSDGVEVLYGYSSVVRTNRS